jgi:hypothetical protein
MNQKHPAARSKTVLTARPRGNFTFRLDDNLRAFVVAEATKHGHSQSEAVIRIIRQWANQWEAIEAKRRELEAELREVKAMRAAERVQALRDAGYQIVWETAGQLAEGNLDKVMIPAAMVEAAAEALRRSKKRAEQAEEDDAEPRPSERKRAAPARASSSHS